MRNNEEHEVSIVKIQKNFDITHLLPEEAVNLAVIVNIFNNASMNVSDKSLLKSKQVFITKPS